MASSTHPQLHGITVSNLNESSPLFGQVKGVLVTRDPNSEAYMAGLRQGDVITAVNRETWPTWRNSARPSVRPQHRRITGAAQRPDLLSGAWRLSNCDTLKRKGSSGALCFPGQRHFRIMSAPANVKTHNFPCGGRLYTEQSRYCNLTVVRKEIPPCTRPSSQP